MQSPDDFRDHTISWKMLVITWLIIATIYLARVWLMGDAVTLFPNTDDAMRMVTVHDLLAGQGWQDNFQYRANTPFGHEMHWSRLIDAPIILLMIGLKPFFGANTYLVAAAIWPILLMFILFYLSARLSVRLSGRESQLAALVVPLILFALLSEFAPGSIDHHNVQILLSMIMLICVIEAQTAKLAPLIAGLACALSISIGLESLVFIALTTICLGLFWTYYGLAWRGRIMLFGLGFAIPTTIIFFALTPQANIFRPDCDALSITYFTASAMIGLIFCLCAIATPRLDHPAKRFAAIAVGGILVCLCEILLFPHCLGGPYTNLDPDLKRIWIDNITEARSVFVAIKLSPAQTIALVFAPSVGLLITLWLAISKRHIGWAIVGLYLGTALVITLFQIRGIRLAAIFCVPAAAYLIGAARARYLITHRLSHAFALIGAWLVFAGIAQFLLLDQAINYFTKAAQTELTEISPLPQQIAAKEIKERPDKCYRAVNFQQLDAIISTRVISPIDLGAHILLFTDHKVVATPYHRNVQGVRDTFDFFNRPHDQARQIAEKRQLTHIVTCSDFIARNLRDNPTQNSLGRMFGRNELPDWLTPLSAKGAIIQIYQISL